MPVPSAAPCPPRERRSSDGCARPTGSARWAPASPRPSNPSLVVKTLASLDPRPGVALAGLLPAGTIDTTMISRRVEELDGGTAWPARPLWIVAVRLADGRRVVFGRDEVAGHVGLGAAVAASSAIPGFFAPVDDRREPATSTAGCTHPRTPTCSATAASTSWSSRPPWPGPGARCGRTRPPWPGPAPGVALDREVSRRSGARGRRCSSCSRGRPTPRSWTAARWTPPPASRWRPGPRPRRWRSWRSPRSPTLVEVLRAG